MKDHNAQLRDRVAAVVRVAALLTATAMTRVSTYPLVPPTALDLFLAFGGGYVLLTAFIGRFAPRRRPNSTALVCLDVVYITGLVWYTGGLRSEYYLLYYLPILNASMRLDFRQAITSSALAALCYAMVMVASGLESTVVNSALLQLATFGGSALVLALFFGTVAALSGSQRELTARLQRAVERLSALYRIARTMHACNSLQSVVDTTLDLAMELSRARAGYLALTGSGGELVVQSSQLAPSEHDARDQPGFDRRLAEHCLVQRAPVVADEHESNAQFPCPPKGWCAVSVPIVYGDHAYGALQLFKRAGDALDEHETELLVALSEEASVALENARLLTEVHRLSVTDELTGLYHRSEFCRLLNCEIERARMSGDPVTVLVFDVDGMRHLNSKHGHQAGDAVLLGFADLLRRCVRAEDVAARYGADEFVLLLPHGGIDAARAVSARLCQAMARREFRFEDDPEVHHFTLCAGAVVTNELPNSADQLIGRADQALFEAKQAGPGHIRFWESAQRRGVVTQVRHIVEQVQRSDDRQWR